MEVSTMKRWLTMATAALLTLPALAAGGTKEWTDDRGHHVIVIDKDGDGHAERAKGAGGYLGVTLGDLDGDEAGEAGKGARIRSVFDDTPAAKAGLEAGDIVVEFGGEEIADAAALSALVRNHEPGDAVKLKARRDGDLKTFTVTLGERENVIQLGEGDWEQFAPGPGAMHWLQEFGDAASGRLGVEVRDLEGPLASYFPGAEAGALVLGVDEDSPAAKAGLEPGDVIVGLGEDKVEDVGDLREAVADLAGEEPGTLAYLRKGQRREATVEIPEADANVFLKRLAGDGPHRERIVRRLDGARENLEQKLEQLERRLEELEKRLEKGGERRG
jgi:C-terminal processing protease CtpA/Prc